MNVPELNRGGFRSSDATMTDVPSPCPSPELAFRCIFEEVYDDLVRFVERRADPAAVEDVVAEVFLAAWRRFDDLPAEVADVRPWLFGVAHRALANDHRGRRRARALAVRVAGQPRHPSEDPAEVVHRVDVARAFDRLGPRDQEALALVAWDGLTPTEAARVLGISVSAFSVRLSRARRRLRAHLEPLTSEEHRS